VSCNCDEIINASLQWKNARLSTAFRCIDNNLILVPALIMVEKIISRGKRPPLVIPTYCPFCGKKYTVKEDLKPSLKCD
jgi:hypothetical protein